MRKLSETVIPCLPEMPKKRYDLETISSVFVGAKCWQSKKKVQVEFGTLRLNEVFHITCLKYVYGS